MSKERTGPPPEKRERRPAGTKAAHLEDKGNRNSTDFTENPAALPAANGAAATLPKRDCRTFDHWLVEYGHLVYPALLPDGVVIADGAKLRLYHLEIDLKGPTAGHCVNTETGKRVVSLCDLAMTTHLPWPHTIVRSAEIIAAALPQGYDRDAFEKAKAAAISAEIWRLEWLACDLAPHGELRRYVLLTWPIRWPREIAGEILKALDRNTLDPRKVRLLLKAHAYATARRDKERQAAEKKQQRLMQRWNEGR